MRGVSALVMMALLVAPVCVRGEGIAQPVPADGKCSVPADEHWTPQEQFVWSRVCVGEKADFNKEPEYGGDLDPKNPGGLPESRILSSAFLETILLRDKYRDALTRRGVRIVGARFTEVIDLGNAELGYDLWLDKSLLEKGANLSLLRTMHRITFDASKIGGQLNMTELQIGGDLSMHGGSEIAELYLGLARIGGQLDLSGLKAAGIVYLSGLRVGGRIKLEGSKITGKLNMESLQAGEDLFLRGGSEFAEVDLRAASIGRTLDLSSSKFAGPLILNQARAHGALFMRDRSEFSDVNFGFAEVGLALDLRYSKVTGALDMSSIRVGGDVFLNHTELANVFLGGAYVRGQLYLDHSKFSGALVMTALQLDGNLLMDYGQFNDIIFGVTHVRGSLSLEGSKVAGVFTGFRDEVSGTMSAGAEFSGPIGFIFVKIGTLILAGGTFHKDVDFEGSQIEDGLILARSASAYAHWSGNPTLILRDASAGAMQDSWDAWPASIDLNGLTYRSLRGAYLRESDPVGEHSVKWFVRWLGRQQHYAPQPYEQLAAVLRNQGRPSAADTVLYAGKERERAQAHFPRIVWLTAMKWFIGYSYHFERALIWVAGLLIVGVAVLRISGEGRRNGMPFGIAYSFDMLLPIIRLREKHYREIDLQGWPRQYFYFHKIMGYILASFLIAGLVGLAK